MRGGYRRDPGREEARPGAWREGKMYAKEETEVVIRIEKWESSV